MDADLSQPVLLEAQHCSIRIHSIAPGAILVTIAGSDVGELADAPFRVLDERFDDDDPIRLFIDARATRGASTDVSEAWAVWFRKRRDRLREVTMLTGSNLVRITADFVRRFADLDAVMHVTPDPAAFDAAVARAASVSH